MFLDCNVFSVKVEFATLIVSGVFVTTSVIGSPQFRESSVLASSFEISVIMTLRVRSLGREKLVNGISFFLVSFVRGGTFRGLMWR